MVAPLDLAIAGAARSGTSFLAAHLSRHPGIDAGAVKESNFFSRNYDRGPEWYESLFQPRAEDVRRMDASVSYTYPQYPEALSRLCAAAPDAYVVYVVRDPVPRAVSHYLFYRHYFKQETAGDFGAALHGKDLYMGASDYRRWLGELYSRYPRDRVLVVPFRAITSRTAEVAERVCSALGLAPAPAADAEVGAHRNNVVTFRHPALRVASRKLRRSKLYPVIRDRLGAARLRRVRSLVTKDTWLPTTEEALKSCTPDQLAQLRELEERCDLAVSDALREQDARLGLDWAGQWVKPDSVPLGGKTVPQRDLEAR